MFYGPGKYHIDQTAKLVIASYNRTILSGHPKTVLKMLDLPDIQNMIGRKKCYIKYRGKSIYLDQLYRMAKDAGLEKYADITTAMLRS